MNKDRLIMSLIFVFLSINLYGSLTIRDIYNKDYDLINRTVISTSEKPTFEIDQQVSDQRIIVNIDNAVRAETVPPNQVFVSPVLDRIRLDESVPEKISVIIETQEEYYLEYFYLDKDNHRIVLDIFNKEAPQTIEEKISFVKFFTMVGFFNRAEPLIQEIIASEPHHTGINYYWGLILLRRGQVEQAIEKLNKVQYDQPEYLPSQIRLINLGVLSYEYEDEMQELFVQIRDYFLRAQDINRQQFLVAWISLLFGNEEETKRLLLAVDDNDPALRTMLSNLEQVAGRLEHDSDLLEEKPALMQIMPAINGADERVLPYSLLIMLIFLLLAAFIVTLIIMRNKISSLRLTLEKEINKMSDKLQDEIDASNKAWEYTEEPAEEEKQTADDGDKDKKQEEEVVPKEDYPAAGPAPINDIELRRELCFRLYNQGWSVEAIAQEINTTVEEVEWFLSKS